jgi:X-X-X-Leu-X-X-Gly heptad repeat protein
MQATRLLIPTLVLVSISAALGCSKRDSANGTVAADSSAAPATGAAAASASSRSGASPDTIVRGTLSNLSDTLLTLSTPTGEVRIAVAQPIKVYTRQPGDLSRVSDRSFVGVTSVAQPDGSQRATEIHVFPEELRGLGEGSRPMAAQAGNGRSTMTNGSVASSRMTNGAARMTNGAAQMTNGTTRSAAGGTMTVDYAGGSQTITVPAGVSVTVIAPTSAKLTPGSSIIVPATKQSNGGLKASLVMLTGAPAPAR